MSPRSERLDLASGTAAPHPEEMRASVELIVGPAVAFRATARATPAGIVAVTVLVATAAASMAWLIRARRADRI